METATGNNGNGTATQKKSKTIFGLPCGCDNRQEILTAGIWQNDAMVIASVLLFALGIYLITRTTSSE
jgi:hypothetical protein